MNFYETVKITWNFLSMLKILVFSSLLLFNTLVILVIPTVYNLAPLLKTFAPPQCSEMVKT